jgi:protein-L-isoaspartate(D-aspartate) O-methyltransferase
MFPLTADDGDGGMLLLTRKSEEVFAAEFVMRLRIYPCMGARETGASMALAEAFRLRDIKDVKSFRRRTAPDRTAWCVGADWWLSTEAP